MTRVVIGVRVVGMQRVQFCETADATLSPGQFVVVEDGHQRALATVVIAPGQLIDAEVEIPHTGQARPATAEEVEQLRPAAKTAGRRLWDSLSPSGR